MKYGDFSSLVQLGVSLHAGTALLQTYGEIGIQPLTRSLSRIRTLVKEADPPNETVADDLNQLDADFDIFRIRLFNEYKKYVAVNVTVAVVLLAILIVISYRAAVPLSCASSVVLVLASVVPGPLTLALLWRKASRQLRPLKSRADALEREAIKPH